MPTSSGALGRAPSLRDEHKARTKRALREAALKLFSTKGYDATTIEEIATLARVSARTFFRYFPTKESVLFLGEPEWLQSFAQVFPGQPASLSDVDAMCATLVELAAGLRNWRSMQLYERAVASSSTLRGREQDHQQMDVDNMAAAVAARRGLAQVDESCALLASIGLMTYRRALKAWLCNPTECALGSVIEAEFRCLAHLFTDTGAERVDRGS